MRTRTLAALALLLLPVVASAQQILTPRPGRGPTSREPLGPQAPVIARELSYVRHPYSIESYPFIGSFRASWDGGAMAWTSGGFGQRIDYRLTGFLSATFDLTSSFWGGPIMTESAELGTRLHARRADRRFYPFLDLRAAMMHSHDAYSRPSFFGAQYSPGSAASFGFSHGVGALAGVGGEYTLTRTLSLIGAASVLRADMENYRFGSGAPTTTAYRLTARRYMLGVRFNPVQYQRTAPLPGFPAF